MPFQYFESMTPKRLIRQIIRVFLFWALVKLILVYYRSNFQALNTSMQIVPPNDEIDYETPQNSSSSELFQLEQLAKLALWVDDRVSELTIDLLKIKTFPVGLIITGMLSITSPIRGAVVVAVSVSYYALKIYFNHVHPYIKQILVFLF